MLRISNTKVWKFPLLSEVEIFWPQLQMYKIRIFGRGGCRGELTNRLCFHKPSSGFQCTLQSEPLPSRKLPKFNDDLGFSKCRSHSSDPNLLYPYIIPNHCLGLSPPSFSVVLYYPDSFLYLTPFLYLFHGLFFSPIFWSFLRLNFASFYFVLCPTRISCTSMISFIHFSHRTFIRVLVFVPSLFISRSAFLTACIEIPSLCSLAS